MQKHLSTCLVAFVIFLVGGMISGRVVMYSAESKLHQKKLALKLTTINTDLDAPITEFVAAQFYTDPSPNVAQDESKLLPNQHENSNQFAPENEILYVRTASGTLYQFVQNHWQTIQLNDIPSDAFEAQPCHRLDKTGFSQNEIVQHLGYEAHRSLSADSRCFLLHTDGRLFVWTDANDIYTVAADGLLIWINGIYWGVIGGILALLIAMLLRSIVVYKRKR
ncbi:MAG: hypothetical protein ACPG8W_07735 [Candidatus Promineifilaceae bacterium]